MDLPTNYTGADSLLKGGEGAAPPLAEMRGGAKRRLRRNRKGGAVVDAAANTASVSTEDPVAEAEATEAEATEEIEVTVPTAPDAASETNEEVPTEYNNASIRASLDDETKQQFAKTLNVFGDKYDLNSSTDYNQYANKPLKRFLADFGIGPDYQDHNNQIIQAFYAVFPNTVSGKPVGPNEQVHEMPEYHLICAFLQYRILTLRFEVQLTVRSSERRTALEAIVRNLQDLLRGGRCGSVNTAAVLRAMDTKKATAAVEQPVEAKVSDIDKKLDEILAELKACCERLSSKLTPDSEFSQTLRDQIQKSIRELKELSTQTPKPE